MIASLSGTLQHKALDRVVVDVGGVGYQVWVSTQALAELPQEGHHVQLLCHTHVREDTLQLYGFLIDQERRAFELLIGVSGIGPRLALTILSGMAVDELIGAVADGNHARLQAIPGVGRKTAERLVVELRDRFSRLGAEGRGAAASRGVDARVDVIEALVNLGYKRPLAERAAQQAVEEQAESQEAVAPEQVLRAALAVIAEL